MQARLSALMPYRVAADVLQYLPPRGKRLIKLAAALATSVSYLIGLDPDAPVPDEYLEEDQGKPAPPDRR